MGKNAPNRNIQRRIKTASLNVKRRQASAANNLAQSRKKLQSDYILKTSHDSKDFQKHLDNSKLDENAYSGAGNSYDHDPSFTNKVSQKNAQYHSQTLNKSMNVPNSNTHPNINSLNQESTVENTLPHNPLIETPNKEKV